jgi:hypothetical protein
LPSLAISYCITSSSSLNSFLRGDITSDEVLDVLSEQAVGLYASTAMATLGQVAIPIPVVGALIGSMVGAIASQYLYQSALDAHRAAKASRQNLEIALARCEAARQVLAQQRVNFETFMSREFAELQASTQRLLKGLGEQSSDPDTFALVINQFAQSLGQRLQFSSITEFESFMRTDDPLVL